MDLKTTRVGFVSLAGGNAADAERAGRTADASQKYIQKQQPFEVVTPDLPVTNHSQAAAAARQLRRSGIDALVIQLGTFVPDTLTVELASALDVPLGLWSVPEPPLDSPTPWCGSTSGLLMHASALTACGRSFEVIAGDPDVEDTRRALSSFLASVAVLRTLRGAAIGLLGRRPPGFYYTAFDALAVRNVFGPTITPIEPAVLDQRFGQISDAQVEQEIAELAAAGWADEVEDSELLRRSVRSSLAIRMIRTELGVDALSTAGPYEGMPASESGVCLAHARLATEGVVAGADADINGLLTMMIQHLLTGRPAFAGEWVETDERNNQALFWNAGGAPEALVNPRLHPVLQRISSGQDCVAVGLPMKTGKVTLARLIAPHGQYRLLIAQGRAVETETPLRGACMTVKFDCDVHDLFRTIIANGFPHRYSLVYQDIAPELLALAGILNLGVITL